MLKKDTAFHKGFDPVREASRRVVLPQLLETLSHNGIGKASLGEREWARLLNELDARAEELYSNLFKAHSGQISATECSLRNQATLQKIREKVGQVSNQPALIFNATAGKKDFNFGKTWLGKRRVK